MQIEDPEAVPELDGIAEVPGLDMIFFGPGDYSHALGYAGDINHPEVDKIRRIIPDIARRHGKFAGTVGTIETLPGLIDMGYQFINLSSDVRALTKMFSEVTEAFARIAG